MRNPAPANRMMRASAMIQVDYLFLHYVLDPYVLFGRWLIRIDIGEFDGLCMISISVELVGRGGIQERPARGYGTG